MLEFIKIDLKQSLMKLEYICLQKDIPFHLVKDLKLGSGDFTQAILIKEGGQFKEGAAIDSKGEIWVSGAPAKDWNTEQTMFMYDMLKETFDMTPFIKIEPKKDLDSILDKISKWGINSLVEEEFEFLFKY